MLNNTLNQLMWLASYPGSFTEKGTGYEATDVV